MTEIKKKPEIVRVEKHLNDELSKYFKGRKNGHVQVGSKKWFLPIKYETVGQKFIDFEIRPDDVWITGIPRSGTTVTEQLAWFFVNDLNFEDMKKPHRIPFFELEMVFEDEAIKERLETHKSDELLEFIKRKENNLRNAEEYKGRRVFKTHLPFELLPQDIFNKGCKVIYVCRNPKDVAVSYFFLQSKLWHTSFTGDFQKFWSFFKNGHCSFGPYFEHVKQGFERRNSKNFLFVFYEDCRKDLTKYIQEFSDFFEKPINEMEMEQLKEFLSFDNFQKIIKVIDHKNNENSQFIRKGNVGGWKEYFDDEMNDEADKWIEENTKKIGFSYPDY